MFQGELVPKRVILPGDNELHGVGLHFKAYEVLQLSKVWECLGIKM